MSSPRIRWSNLKSAVFGTSSSLPPIDSEGGGLVCESVGKAYLLGDHFDSKQSREAVDLRLTCYPSPILTTFAFRSREVRRLLLDLDPYGSTDPVGMFSIFFKRTADVMVPRLTIVFGVSLAWVVSPLAGDRQMTLQFRKVHRPPLLPITDHFP